MSGVRTLVLKPSHLIASVEEEIDLRVALGEDQLWNDQSGRVVLVEDGEHFVLARSLGNMISTRADV